MESLGFAQSSSALFSKIATVAAIAGLLFCLPSRSSAQTFLSAQTVLASGYGGPAGLAVDRFGDLFVSEYDGGTIDEIQATNGVITATSPIRVLAQCQIDCQGGIAVDASGDVFFIDYQYVREILAVNGTISSSPTILTFSSSALSFPRALALAPNGDLFISDYSTGVISRIGAVNGSIPPSASVVPVVSGFPNTQGIYFDLSGNLYVVNGAVQEILAVNGTIPASPTVIPVPGGAGGDRGVAVDASGNVYFSDDNLNVVKEILAVNGAIPTNPTVLTLMGQGLDAVDGIAVDQRGTVYAANIGLGQVIEISPTQNFSNVNVGSTSAVASLHITFLAPTAIGAIDVLTEGQAGSEFANVGGGGLTCIPNYSYAGNQTCAVNVSFTPKLSGTRVGAAIIRDVNGNPMATANLIGTGVAPQLSYLPGVHAILGSGFSQPTAAAIDGAGNVFVADNATHSVMEIVAVNGQIPPSPTIKLLGSAQTYPTGIAVDGSGNVILASSGLSAVYELTKSSGYSSIVPLGGGFRSPTGVAVDGNGNVLVADYGSNKVKKIPIGCSTSSCVVALGSGFQGPTSIAVDSSGNIFVADSNNSAIKEITASSLYQTTQTVVSGVSSIYGLAVDAAGDLYFSSDAGNALEEYLASTGYSQAITVAQGFSNPRHIAIAANGNLLVADTGNNQVIQVDTFDVPTLNFASTLVGSTSADSPQTLTVQNIGNQNLIFPIPVSGTNPAIFSPFWLNSTGQSACPLVSSTSFEAGTLISGAACTLPVSFSPTTGGTFAGALALTDNNLNAAAPGYATQNIALNGIGLVTPTILWHTPAPIMYGTALGASQLNATASVPGTFAYSPATDTVLAAGSQTLSVTFTPTDTAHYTTATATVQIVVNKATPVITWPTPAAITYGTPLGAAQLDAAANVPGTFAYSPSAGTVLPVGSNTLNATFTPTDTTDFNPATSSVVLIVKSAAGFSLSASPSSLTLKQTASTSSTITIAPFGGFAGSVTLSVSGLPSGVTVSYSRNPTTTASVLTFKATGSATIGVKTVIVTGISGNVSSSASITLNVTSKK